MLTTQIEYKTSKDYKQLYNLLKEGKILIGFIAIDIDRVPDMELSKVAEFRYNQGIFYIGNLMAMEPLCDKEQFIKICQEHNLQYIPLSE